MTLKKNAWYNIITMLKGDDIKRLVKNAENWQVEFKLAKGGVPDTFWESYSSARTCFAAHSAGTGKETVALQIHNRSPRKAEPFYAFNCASVNPELLSSRFFGHEKGTFTSVDRRELGLFELAHGERVVKFVRHNNCVFCYTTKRNGDIIHNGEFYDFRSQGGSGVRPCFLRG